MKKIFLSYKSEDREFVKELRNTLTNWGYDTWMDVFDIPKGAYWPDEIDKGLNECDIVLGVMSPLAVQSRNVKNEWDWAIVYHRPLKLVMREECYVPMNYISINYIYCVSAAQGSGITQLQDALASELSVEPQRTDPYRDYLEQIYTRINKFLSQKIIVSLKDKENTPEPLRLQTEKRTAMVAESHEKQEDIDPLFALSGISDESDKGFNEINQAIEYYEGRVLLLGEPGSGKTIRTHLKIKKASV